MTPWRLPENRAALDAVLPHAGWSHPDEPGRPSMKMIPPDGNGWGWSIFVHSDIKYACSAKLNVPPEQSRAEQSRADSLTLTAPSEAENGEREREGVIDVLGVASERLPKHLATKANASEWLAAAGGDAGVARQGICDCAKTKPRTPEYVRRAIELRAAERAAAEDALRKAKQEREEEARRLREPRTWEEWHRHGMIVKGLSRDEAAKLATERAGNPPWAGGVANGHVRGREGATGHSRAICGQSAGVS